MVTPFGEDGSVNYSVAEALAAHLVDNGSDGLVVCGTTGESPTLSWDEEFQLYKCVKSAVGDRAKVIVGTGSNSTQEAIEATQKAAALNLDGSLQVVPYYHKPTQAGLLAHYSAVADAVDMPQILYNVPGRTACDLLPETAAELSRVPNIIGIKDATGDLARVEQLRRLCDDGFALYSGDDASACEFMLRGGDGVISVTSNVAPRLMAQMCAAALAGDREHALACNQRLDGLHHALFVESNPIPVKWAMHVMGLSPEGIRLPLTWLTAHCHEAVRAAMVRAGVL